MKALLNASADVAMEYSEDGSIVEDDFSALDSYSLVNYSPRRMLHADYSQAAFKHVLDLGSPFISIASPCTDRITGKSIPALALLAKHCGLRWTESFNILDKTVLLLSRGANVSCRDSFGNTVLHLVISSGRLPKPRRRGTTRWFVSLTQPFNLLVLFMTAGADVYATNDAGETPSMVAMQYGRMDEWTSALAMCGYDVEEVLDHPSPCCKDCIPKHQTAQQSFETWCEQLGGPDYDSFRCPDGSWDSCDEDSDECDEDSDEDRDELDEDSDGGSSQDRDKGSYEENTCTNIDEDHLHITQGVATRCSDEETAQLDDSQY